MTNITTQTVQSYFDAEAQNGRRLLPDERTVSGLGSYVKYQRAASLMAEPCHSRVLDVGCNRGSIEVLFQKLYPDQSSSTFVEGVDISTEAVKQAQALELTNCRFQLYDGIKLPYASASFDLVIMIEVIEHVMQKDDLLEEVYRVLRPGGHLFLTTPNSESSALRFELFLWASLRRIFNRPVPEKDAFLSHEDLEEILGDLKFQTVGEKTMYYWPRLYFYFLGWSIFPLLPPKWLLAYQKFCADHIHPQYVPKRLARRIFWSLVALLEKRTLHTHF